MAPLVEDLIKLLDHTSNSLRRGRYPDRAEARKIAGLLRAFADNLDACTTVTPARGRGGSAQRRADGRGQPRGVGAVEQGTPPRRSPRRRGRG